MAKKKQKLSKAPKSASKPTQHHTYASSGSAKIKMAEVGKIRTIQGKYNRPLRGSQKEIDQSNKELSKLRRPIYNLNSQIRNETSRYRKGKLRKKLNEYLSGHEHEIDAIKERRSDIRELKKNTDSLKSEKARLKRELKKIDAALEAAEEDTDWEKVKELTFQKLKVDGQLGSIDEALGKKKRGKKEEEYEVDEEEDARGYIEDPANPYTVWEAAKQFEADLANEKQWKFMVINKKRMSTKNKVMCNAQASTLWLISNQMKTNTPVVYRFYNLKKKTVKYTAYK